MSRNKKSRKPGAMGEVEVVVTRNRTESDVEGRLRKKVKNRKGLKTGNRNAESAGSHSGSAKTAKDPRIGSKKQIQLVVNKSKPSKKERKLSAKRELELLENDAQLNVLLDRIEQGEKLGAGLQSFVDEKLDRIEVLMKQLGYFDQEPEESELEEVKEVEQPKKKSVKQAPLSEDDLLAQFENVNLDDLKG